LLNEQNIIPPQGVKYTEMKRIINKNLAADNLPLKKEPKFEKGVVKDGGEYVNLKTGKRMSVEEYNL
jgi:hypothetical protein